MVAQILTFIILAGFVLAAADYVRAFVEGRATYRRYLAEGSCDSERAAHAAPKPAAHGKQAPAREGAKR